VHQAGGIQAVSRKLAGPSTVILDGATGTELQRRGVPMDSGAWCALATASHPGVLRAVHEDYIRAGADIVTANTFATARHLLEHAGVGDRAAELFRRSVAIAREAVARTAAEVARPVAVAGSISTMRPVAAGTDQRDHTVDLAAIPWAANLREAADRLAEAGADLLLLEMICDLDHGMLALEAALATGLPVWVGLSARRRGGAGPLMSYRDDGPPFADLVRHYAAQPIGALGVMHTSLPDTEEALPLLLGRSTLPVMAYPEAGHFRAPDWQFVQVEPAAFAATARTWAAAGVRVVGGCCGLGPEHIAALAADALAGRRGPPVGG
jgi:S-methylmethionine-dependent homocysteine/selenocysteine methylase